MSAPRVRRVRVDQLLVLRGLASSRAKAQAMVMAGAVSSRGNRIDKAGALLDVDAEIILSGEAARFVSRGGEKLERALLGFADSGLDVDGVTALDIGASTGGFTDCLLARGAKKVYAVDVGYGQLDYKLRRDPRVIVRERTNAKNLTLADFAEPIDLVVVDASFIGLGKLMPTIARILEPGGKLVALVKPQFEAGRQAANHGRGVIRDSEVRDQAIASARQSVISAGFSVESEIDSALPGPKGNVERFLYAIRRTI